MPPLQPRARGGPSSPGLRAANSLYTLDATADEGAAGRPQVQEGQAGRSAQSGLATGTENRREMNSVKRGRDREVKGAGVGGETEGGRGRGARGSRDVGKVGGLWGELGRPGSWGGGSRCCRGAGGGTEEGKEHLALGEVEKWVLPKATVREERTKDVRKESRRAARPGHSDYVGLRTLG